MAGRQGASRAIFLFLIFLLSACSSSPVADRPVDAATGDKWWNIPYPSAFDASQLSPQSFLRVEGNTIVDAAGAPFVLRGVSIGDPDKLKQQKQWRKGVFEEIADWGANTVRIPVHPVAYRRRGREAYLALIDQAVSWANAEGLYLILDWHSIGLLDTGLFQHSMYDTSRAETFRFWKDVAARYRNVPTLAIYELFNEPTSMGGALGRPDWHQWKSTLEELIDLIAAADPGVIPLVAGFNWAYDLSWVERHPIERPGIAYAIHPYPQKESPARPTRENFHQLWQQNWGHLADRYPLLATEIGWASANEKGAHVPVIDDGSYGPRIVEFLEERGIGWTVWCFDPDWSPAMIEDWSFAPTGQGRFFRDVMLRKQQETEMIGEAKDAAGLPTIDAQSPAD